MSADYINTAKEDFRDVLTGVTPGLLVAGVWESEQAAEIPWENFTIPYEVIVFSEFEPDTEGEWGVTNQVYECNAEVYHVDNAPGGNSALTTKAQQIADAFDSISLAKSFQVLYAGAISASRNLEPNRLFADKRMKQRAVRVTVRILVGQTQVA